MKSHELDQRIILEKSPIRSIHYRASVGSTNDVAKSLACSIDELPALVIAGKQISGRGQGNNTWWSGPGSLTFSVLMDGRNFHTPGLIPVAVAIATVNAIADLESRLNPAIKWPNDIFIGSKKVAGILVESQLRNQVPFYVLGIGINSNCQLQAAPASVSRSSISITDFLGHPIDQTELLVDLLNRQTVELDRINDSPSELVERYESKSIFEKNSTLKIRMADGELKSGQFVGFGRQGELIICENREFQRIVSARIEHFSSQHGD